MPCAASPASARHVRESYEDPSSRFLRTSFHLSLQSNWPTGAMTSTMSILVAKRIPRAISRTRAIDPAPRGFTRSGSVKNPIHRKRLSKIYQRTNILPKWLGDHDFLFRTNNERSDNNTYELKTIISNT